MSVSQSQLDLRMAEFLDHAALFTKETIQEASAESKKNKTSLLEVLSKKFNPDENKLYEALAEKAGIPFLSAKPIAVDPQVISKVPIKVAAHYAFMPLEVKSGKLLVAVESPLSIKTQDEIRLQLGISVQQSLARRKDILDALKKHYGFAAETIDRIVSGSESDSWPKEEAVNVIDRVDRMAGDATVVDLVNEIIHDAYQKRSTDIHFEPYRDEFRVRCRIDGVLQDVNLPPKAKHLILPILSRIKIMANLDIVEKRLPQDGRAIVRIQNQNLDLRISSIPSSRGESVVIRILPTYMIFDLKKLGLADKNIQILENIIRKPNGIVLLTGPTGSGKTTTLYACLNLINSKERKIITIEDPVEYEIPGITQIQISNKIGFDFAKGLRSMLRHDPDVMMVGEIRDFETAEIAIRAALTGHMVFSTLHTNDASSGVARLLDIGVEPFLVASSVEAIIAQRLIRTICPHCKKEDASQPAALKQKIAQDLALSGPDQVKIYKGQGCDQCGHTGFYGRTALHEILVMSETIKKLVASKASSHEIKLRAVTEGMDTLLQDGWKKVLAGETTPGEVVSVAHFNFEPAAKETDLSDQAASGFVRNQPKIEQRIFERLSMRLKVSYTRFEVHYKLFRREPSETDLPEEDHVGYTEDVSAGGIGMEIYQPLAVGAILDLQFKLKPDSERVIRCLGRAVRVEESEGATGYTVGIVFLDLSTSDRAYLYEFVQKIKEGTA